MIFLKKCLRSSTLNSKFPDMKGYPMINFNEIQGCVFHPQGPKEIANIQIDNIIKITIYF